MDENILKGKAARLLAQFVRQRKIALRSFWLLQVLVFFGNTLK